MPDGLTNSPCRYSKNTAAPSGSLFGCTTPTHMHPTFYPTMYQIRSLEIATTKEIAKCDLVEEATKQYLANIET